MSSSLLIVERPTSHQLCTAKYRDELKMLSERSSMSQELLRIATFKDYPYGDTPSVITLARSGFIYAGREFTVKCPMCGIEIKQFEHRRNPLDEHRKRSPNCPLAAQSFGSISLSALDTLPEDVKQNSLAMLAIFKSALRRSGELVQTNEPSVSASTTESSPNKIDRNNPDYELHRCERYRLSTFYDWPATANAVPGELAREGLFYTGIGDKVRCAFCRNVLHSWELGDIPREEHQKYYPNCPFVQNHDLQIENGSIQENFAQNPDSIASSLAASSGQIADPIDSRLPNGTNVSVDVFMSSPTVRAVLEMGFSAEVVKQIIQQHLDETGELYPNAESLLDKLLSLGFKMSSIPSIVDTNQTSIPKSTASAVMQNETTACTTSAEQMVHHSTVSDPESGGKKKHKTRRRKAVALTSNTTGSTLGSTTNSISVSAALLQNNTTTSTTGTTTASTAASTNEAANYAEGEENNGMLLDLEEQELIEENTRLKEARICKVCMDKETDTVFLPCGHLICCDFCSPKVKNCPLCRTFIRGTVKTYLS